MLDKKLIELDTRLLAAFRAVAEELHFGRAASRLFLSQPPLSAQVKRLEQIVDAQLFSRTTRSVSLTPAGRVFQAHLYDILERMEVMLKETRNAAEGESGVLSVGLTPAACSSSVVTLLHDFRHQHPGVTLELMELSSLEMPQALRRGAIDVGVMRPGPPQADISEIGSIEEPICLAVRIDHPLARHNTIDARQLASAPLIDYHPNAAPYLHDKVRHICAHYEIVPNIVQASRLPTILTLVEAGSGTTLAPLSAINSKNLKAIPLESNPAAVATLHLAMWDANRSSIVERFLQTLSEIGVVK